jgi:AcrR family transcriptional regulator
MSTSLKTVPTRSRGRPREFDMDEALDKAIHVFAERGYHAASISELTAAMELAQGSVYKAFGDKRAIFLAALDRYKMLRNKALDDALAGGQSGLECVRIALHYYADASHGEAGRHGCLMVGTATELAILDQEVAERVARSQERSKALLARLINQGISDGSIRQTVDSDTAAAVLLCLTQGMRVIGKTGRTQAEMAGIAEAAMHMLA